MLISNFFVLLALVYFFIFHYATPSYLNLLVLFKGDSCSTNVGVFFYCFLLQFSFYLRRARRKSGWKLSMTSCYQIFIECLFDL